MRAPKDFHVAKQSTTWEFAPTVVEDCANLIDDVIKIVWVSDDTEKVSASGQAGRDQFGDRVSAAGSQRHCLDVTPPDANREMIAHWIARYLGIQIDQIAIL
ncbi:MAG: HAD hydrolase family protein [Solirubrobacteraceae bacterium]